jgi:fatty acid amide hydrolase
MIRNLKSLCASATKLQQACPYIMVSQWDLSVWFMWATSVALVAITTILLRSKLKKDARTAELSKGIAKALQEREAKIHKCLEIAAEENGLRTLTAVETRDQIASGKLDPSMYVVWLAKRCRRYGRDEKRVNAITEELYDEAYEAAKLLKTRGKRGKHAPLHGVPISVKDCIGLKGAYSTGGLACRLGRRDAQDSLVVQVSRSSGALPLCRGNVPQIMMIPETTNSIWGRSRNPWNLSRTPGGSSGGDGALVAMGCVPLSICSAVAGSIRIPAAFCGVTGFKPTSTLLSNKGNMKPRKDDKFGSSVAIPVTVGPIARSVDDCALFMKAVCVPELFEKDLNIPHLPFDEKAYQSSTPLKIGYFSTDGWFEPCETAKRALQETIDALTRAGHECVPFEPPTDGWFSYGLYVSRGFSVLKLLVCLYSLILPCL